MKKERIEAPEMILKPKCCVNERIVLGNSTNLEPDSIKPMQITQRGVLGNIIVIVPNKAATQRGKVDDNGYYEEEEIRKNGMSNECPPGARFALRLRLAAHEFW